MPRSEFQIVRAFSRILNLENRTDGTLFIYPRPQEDGGWARKPDGYYYADGVTFILDAKAEKQPFIGQLEDYMNLEQNDNFVGFKYSGDVFKCYIRGEFKENEREPQSYQYYIDTYFQNKHTNESIVEKSAQKLANMFRSARIDKQMNVPFIGAVMLCLKFNQQIDHTTTAGILRNVKMGIEEVISDTPLERRQKKEFLKTVLGDSTLNKCKFENLLMIISEISTIYNFINVSERVGHDTMNNFLKVFRHWNSANANEKGEVFTPDHIAQLMYRLINCSKNDVILDPTCGSGTFLTNAMANMLNECETEDERRDVKENRVLGIEDNDFNATLAGINMMLHGDGASNIFNDDCFRRLPRLRNCYNKVLMNPPFSQDIPELEFVFQTLNNMKQDGLCATILPISCALGREWKKIRKQILLKHSLLKSIKLPKDLFQPNAGTDTCILIFKAHEVREIQTIEKYDFSDDGFKIKTRNGRVNINNKEKTEEFFRQQPIVENVTFLDDWLIEKRFDYNKLAKIDFLKAKIDFNLINVDLMDVLSRNNGNLTLNIFVSDVPLNTNSWKEFKISELFTIEGKGKDSIDKNGNESYMPCVNAKKNNNGIGGYVDNPKKIFDGKKITVVTQGDGGAGMTYYQDREFCATSSVLVLQPLNFEISKEIGIFIAKICSLSWKPIYSHGKSLTKDVLMNEVIKLPVDRNNNPDWNWIRKYINNTL